MTLRNHFRQIPAVAILIVCLFSGCSGKVEKGAAANPERVRTDKSIKFDFAVYLLPTSTGDPQKIFRETAAKEYPALKVVPEIQGESQEMRVAGDSQANAGKEYAPPDLQALRHDGVGLTPDQERSLQKSDRAFILHFAQPGGLRWVALRTANQLVETVARRTRGLIWDEETRQVFTPDAWHQRRLASWDDDVPRIASQTLIHSYRNGDFVRAITLGMAKVGLPDVVVTNFTWSSENQVGSLINAFCQILAEGAAISVPGKYELNLTEIKNLESKKNQTGVLKANASGLAYLWLDKGRWEEGDPRNRLIELSAKRYSEPDVHARQEKMLQCLYGSRDGVRSIEHTEELLQASRSARMKLSDFKTAFNKGLAPGEYIEVKAPFRTRAGGNEWMWVEVTKWSGDKIEGLLRNTPEEVPNLYSGQLVRISEQDIFDYIHTNPDGTQEGNTTGEIIKKMSAERDTEGHSFRDGKLPFAVKHGMPGCQPD